MSWTPKIGMMVERVRGAEWTSRGITMGYRAHILEVSYDDEFTVYDKNKNIYMGHTSCWEPIEQPVKVDKKYEDLYT